MAFPLALLAPLIPILIQHIPDIGRLIAGDTGERVATAVQSVAGSLDPTAVAAAVSDPRNAADLMSKVEEIRAQVRLAEIKRDADAFAAAMRDVADARATSVALASTGSRIAWAPAVVSVIIVTGFFGCVALVTLVEKSWDERTAALINTLLGALTISFGQVCNYWLGSSRGSAAKDERTEAAMTAMSARRGVVALPEVDEPVATPAQPTSARRSLFSRRD